MKKFLLTAAVAVFALGAFAQEGSAPKAKDQTKTAPAKMDSTKGKKKSVKAVPASKPESEKKASKKETPKN